MELDTDKIIEYAIRDGFRDAIKTKFSSSYNNPLDKILDSAISAQGAAFRSLLDDALKEIVGEETFRHDVKSGLRHTLARTLVARFGGELEKQVNVLKSDPATRARITIAIEDIVKQKTEA